MRAELDATTLPPSQRAAFIEAAYDKAKGYPPGTLAKMYQAAQKQTEDSYAAFVARIAKMNTGGEQAPPPAALVDEEPALAPLFRRRRPAFRPD